MRLRNRSLAFLVSGTIATLLSANLLDAQARPRDQYDDRITAVIVVGKPRIAAHVRTVNGARQGLLDLNVRPRNTSVWIDGELRGSCEAFDGFPSKLALEPGIHRIKFVTPDGIQAARDVRIRAGVEINVGLDVR
jgi:hypothetical protein